MTQVQPMNSPQYYKTFYLGVENTGEIIDNDDIILLDDKNVWSYGDLTGTLNDEFWKTSFHYQQGLRKGPRKVKLLITNMQAKGLKCNLNNKFTSLQTVEWFLNEMVSPLGGMIISIYFYQNLYPGIGGTWTSRTVWPLKRQWIGDGDYITIQSISSNSSSGKSQISRQIGHTRIIKNAEKLCPYPIKYISYEDGEEETLNKLIHTKRHFTYIGGTYNIAPMINIPTICYGDPIPINKKGPIYDIKTINWPDKNLRKMIYYENSQYNSSVCGQSATRVQHYDTKKQICICKPQTSIKHVHELNELLAYITFTKDLVLLQRDRKDWTEFTDLPLWP
jgi:hypothetical protein